MVTDRDETRLLRGTILWLEAQVSGLRYELRMRDIRLAEKDRHIAELERRVEELKKQAVGAGDSAPGALPSFVKPDVPRRRRKNPGRQKGHEAALRPMPAKIDHHQTVPLATDSSHRAVCPHCRCSLSRRRRHRRLVEDLVPSAVQTTCHHTGRCR